MGSHYSHLTLEERRKMNVGDRPMCRRARLHRPLDAIGRPF